MYSHNMIRVLLVLSLAWCIRAGSSVSVGDPHIIPFNVSDNPYYPSIWMPGVQYSGDFVLAEVGITRVIEHQSPCGNAAFCNDRTTIVVGSVVTIVTIVVYPNDTVTTSPAVFPPGTVQINRESENRYVISTPDAVTTVLSYYGIQAIQVETDAEPSGGLATKIMGPNSPNTGNAFNDFILSWRLSSDGGSSLGTRSVKSDVNVDAIAACDKLLDLVPQCAGFLGDSPFTDACIYDVDQIQNPGLATTIIDSYALKCLELANAAGVHIDLPASADYSVAYGPGLETIVPGDKSTWFIIQSRDVNYTNVTTGGDTYNVSSTGATPIAFSPPEYLGKGQYKITYTTPASGAFVISIRMGFADIENSPYTIIFSAAPTTPAVPTPVPTSPPNCPQCLLVSCCGLLSPVCILCGILG